LPADEGVDPAWGEVAVFGRILQRMILWELLKVFLIALVGITGILLMAGIIAEASQQGLAPSQVLAAIPLLVPSTLPYTIPATTLFATCVVYGRLAADNEILAVKSAGVNVLSLVKPGILLGLAMSVATMGLYWSAIPRTHRLLRALIFQDARELLYTLLKKHGSIRQPGQPYALFVEDVRGERLVGPVIKHKDGEGKIDFVASAHDGDLHVETDSNTLVLHMKNCTVTFADGSRAFFEEHPWTWPLPREFAGEGDQRPRDLTWEEIHQHQEETEDECDSTLRSLIQTTVQFLWADVPGDGAKRLRNLTERVQNHRRQLLALDVEVLMRPAISVGCLFFILVGCPVGILLSRSDYLSSFIICFLPIVFIYYPLLLCGTGMAKEGRLSPLPLVWAANTVVAFVGLGLFRRLLKH
jgi:lipopolysaccharide export system permease protein